MLAQVSRSRPEAANPVAVAFIAFAFILSGGLLLALAFSSAAFGRLVTQAWVAGVMGLAFLIPGAVALGYGVLRAFKARRHRN